MDYSVVVAEDEALLLVSLAQKISQADLGFTVTGMAKNGQEAIELIKKDAPDLLITDIKMPVLSGLELIKRVRNDFPHMRIVITSGFSDFEYAKTAIQYQVSDYLLKPIDPEELHTSLKSIRNQLALDQKEYADIFNAETTKETPEDIAKILKDYISQNYMEDINLNLIAKNMNYSPSYLTKLFQQLYGTSPSKFLTHVRISKAKHYLSRNPELSIRQIGELVGYPDQSYFSRIFKKYTDMSPFDYREPSE